MRGERTTLGPKGIPIQRFWRFVTITESCWIWTGYKSQGYGRFSITKHWHEQAHRVAFVLLTGRIPRGKVVMHLCDSKDCCNPAHLRLGTDAQNARDAEARGQIQRQRGPGNHMAKLSWDQVREIRSRWANGERHQRRIALDYGVHQRAISTVVRGETYVEA